MHTQNPHLLQRTTQPGEKVATVEVSGAGAHGEFDVQVLTPTLVGVDKGDVRDDKAVFDVVAGA